MTLVAPRRRTSDRLPRRAPARLPGRTGPARRIRSVGALALGLAALALGACQSVPVDRSALAADMPRSILALPPVNESVDANASYSFLSTVTRPLAEMGYYVFPVAVVDAYMRENGLQDPAEMQAVPLAKLDEVFAPDAVLYTTLAEFGQKFELLSSTTRVEASARLVDADTGTELWRGEIEHAEGSAPTGGGLLGEILGAALAQTAATLGDATHASAGRAGRLLFADRASGLLPGPRHPEYVDVAGGPR